MSMKHRDEEFLRCIVDSIRLIRIIERRLVYFVNKCNKNIIIILQLFLQVQPSHKKQRLEQEHLLIILE